jgi:hypothetical protein
MSMTSKNGSAGPMLTSTEAAKRLGISPRHFARLRAKLGRIDGATLVDGAWAFPEESIEKLADRGTELEEDDTLEESEATLLREVVRASKDVHASGKQAIETAVDALKLVLGAYAQTLAESKSKDERLNESQKQQLESMKLLREFIIGTGELEAQRIKTEADQTVRIERTKVAAKGMKLFAPIVKAGLGRVLHMPMLARDAQSETLLELFRGLKDGKREKLLAVMNDKQREAFENLATYAAAHEGIEDSLKVLKDELLEHPEQMGELQGFLDQKEIGAILSLFEGDEEDEKKAEEPEKKSA